MPRIRKSEYYVSSSESSPIIALLCPETSKRGTTARRAKIQHKVAEGRKKSKKAAKKDSTWKSSACACVHTLAYTSIVNTPLC
jgi:hypothetical protein